MAMRDLTKSTYSGEFGFLIVEPAAGDPGGYDREILLASHAWEGEWVSMQDIKKGPINSKSWPDTNPLFTVQQGKRYRLLLDNNSGDEHPVHTHRHTFEVTKVNDRPMSGLMKDTISLTRFSKAEIDFVANDPGPTFFHCHHQDHMDEGFAGLITYAVHAD
jgi:FtsP/CotA-like multicopper oxidase with cupredoxin domain